MEGLLAGSDSTEPTCNAGDPVLSPVREDPLEKEMATQSSILAWRMPCTEEPGGYGPWGGKESGITNTCTFFHTYV